MSVPLFATLTAFPVVVLCLPGCFAPLLLCLRYQCSGGFYSIFLKYNVCTSNTVLVIGVIGTVQYTQLSSIYMKQPKAVLQVLISAEDKDRSKLPCM